ncbi:hypothetical protein GCM10027396_35670 [Insolitispirillum peregrinum]|uniref:diguanylate cyclase n=2 Tax=Insolitispirillum peregrinum TaxID=80876 RepID=A0A1N7MX39_9PROT|nr:diguanylate cyclase (GGDEF) domain-containing protein [Insolitispirillum peregrinum]
MMMMAVPWDTLCTVMDERLARLFLAWQSDCAPVEPLEAFAGHVDHMLIIEMNGAKSRYQHYGAAFVANFGKDLTGEVIDLLPSEILPASQRGMLEFEYTYAQRNQCPLWRSYSGKFGDHFETWQRLVLPLGPDRLAVGAYPVAGQGGQPPALEDPQTSLLRLVVGRVPVRLSHDGALVDLALSLKTYSDSRIHMEELEILATRDALTGVANLRHFHHLSNLELDHAHRMGRPLAVLGLDIDHFKVINDTWGHAVGDEALKSFAHACRRAIRELDVLGRCGGEEFAITLPNTAAAGAVVLAERLRQQVEAIRLPMKDGSELRFTVSIGVAVDVPYAEDQARTIADLLARADEALYRAKNGGRNQVVVS